MAERFLVVERRFPFVVDDGTATVDEFDTYGDASEHLDARDLDRGRYLALMVLDAGADRFRTSSSRSR